MRDDREDTSKPIMKHSMRVAWLLNEVKHRIFVNVLNQDFSDGYIKITNAPHEIMLYGANRCPMLGRDLSKMYRAGLLCRDVTGVEDARSLQFPTWVWTYSLPDKKD